MIKIKNDAELEGMRSAGRITAQVRDAVGKKVAPGVTTGELDAYAAELIRDLGGESAFLGYRGFPGHICSSVNDEIVHVAEPGRYQSGSHCGLLDSGPAHAPLTGILLRQNQR